MPEWQQSSTIVSLHPDGSGAMSVSKTYARRHRGLLPSVATRSVVRMRNAHIAKKCQSK